MVKYRNICNTMQALNCDAPKLNILVRQLGEAKIMQYVKIWLIELNRALDLKKPLKEYQINQIAFAIVDRYRSLNLAEVNLIFKNAKHGEYGDLMRITVPTVLKWFKDYYSDRANMAGEQSYQRSVQHKSAFGNSPRSFETQQAAGREMQKALSFQEKKKGLSQAQKRVDKLKQKLK